MICLPLITGVIEVNICTCLLILFFLKWLLGHWGFVHWVKEKGTLLDVDYIIQDACNDGDQLVVEYSGLGFLINVSS
jgi:hypothetical protein